MRNFFKFFNRFGEEEDTTPKESIRKKTPRDKLTSGISLFEQKTGEKIQLDLEQGFHEESLKGILPQMREILVKYFGEEMTERIHAQKYDDNIHALLNLLQMTPENMQLIDIASSYIRTRNAVTEMIEAKKPPPQQKRHHTIKPVETKFSPELQKEKAMRDFVHYLTNIINNLRIIAEKQGRQKQMNQALELLKIEGNAVYNGSSQDTSSLRDLVEQTFSLLDLAKGTAELNALLESGAKQIDRVDYSDEAWVVLRKFHLERVLNDLDRLNQ